MPEALAILLVFAICVGLMVLARFKSSDPAVHGPAAEAARLDHQRKWLADRLELARKERWDKKMVSSIERELAALGREA